MGDCITGLWWCGGSGQSKRFESQFGVQRIDLIRAATLDRPLEHIQVTIHGCIAACPFIPWTALAPEPLQRLQVTTLSCTSACTFIPRATLAPEPLQYLQVTTFGCTRPCACTPRAALA